MFDGCKHGYNSLFCDSFSKAQTQNRPITKIYRDDDGNEFFEIIISTLYCINFEEEIGNQIDETGLVELINGSKIEFDTVKRNGFDSIQIWSINEAGRMIEIISQECA